jgi:hypothetical protein
LRVGDDFICIGEPAIGNGPTTLIIAARVAELGLRQRQRAFISNSGITVGDALFDLRNCATWRAPPWPIASAALPATCAEIAQRAAVESPADSLARVAFKDSQTSSCPAKAGHPVTTGPNIWSRGLGLLDRPLSRAMTSERLVHNLIGLGYGLTPSGDDFLVGALAALDALKQTNMHAALGRAVSAAADRTSPLSASFLRAAAAGQVGENLYTMIAALLTGDADAALAAAARIGHTSGWDTLAGAVVTARNRYRC